jgi:hypothetical protein
MSSNYLTVRFQDWPCGTHVRLTAVSLALVTLLLLTGCGTTNKEQAGSNSGIREGSGGEGVHSEVGAMYGRNLR